MGRQEGEQQEAMQQLQELRDQEVCVTLNRLVCLFWSNFNTPYPSIYPSTAGSGPADVWALSPRAGEKGGGADDYGGGGGRRNSMESIGHSTAAPSYHETGLEVKEVGL